ncbi:MAG: transporter [Bacteroidales bacterium]
MEKLFFKNTVLIVLVHLLTFTLNAQINEPGLITDRPDQTESSAIVPVSKVQIETGMVLENDQSDLIKQKSFVYNSTLLRYGVFSNFELRLGLEYAKDRFILNDSATIASGFSPLYTGFKIKISEEDKWLPEIAFLGGFVMPFTAGKDYKPSYSAANLRFAFSHTLSEMFSIGYNLGMEYDGESAIPGYFYSVAIGIGISEKIGMFIESYGIIYEEGNAEHLTDFGFTYLLLPGFQIDISAGKGINENATDYFFGMGLSYLFR